MKTVYMLIVSLAFGLGAFNAMALSPQIEADRLILAGKNKILERNFAEARTYLDRVEGLGITPNNDYHWLMGQVLFHEKRFVDAKIRVEKYVESGGSKLDNYHEALLLLTEIETQLSNKQSDLATKEKSEVLAKEWEQSSSVQDSNQGATYDAKVKALYMGQNLTSSLTLHINGLLQSYVFIEGKVKNRQKADHLRYSISVSNSGDILLTKKDVKVGKSSAASAINISRLSAFGVSPVVRYRCSKQVDSCSIISPVDGSDLIRVAKDDNGAKEIARALGRLIKSIQRG